MGLQDRRGEIARQNKQHRLSGGGNSGGTPEEETASSGWIRHTSRDKEGISVSRHNIRTSFSSSFLLTPRRLKSMFPWT